MENNQTCLRILADKDQIERCRLEIQKNKKPIAKLSSLLSLLGSEVRLKVVYLLLQEKELCPCDLSDILGMSIPAVSQHLRKLKDGNLIENRRDGQTIFYSILSGNDTLLRPIFKNLINISKTEEV